MSAILPRRDRLVSLLACIRLTWRERCLLLALAELADSRGRVVFGDVRLSEEAAKLGDRAAEEGRHRRGAYRGRARPFDLRYFRRVLARLAQLGLVRRRWVLPPSRRWVRVLSIWERALEDCAHRPAMMYDRRWDSRLDTIPASVWPDPSRPWVVGRLVRRMLSRGRVHARTADGWRQCYGRETDGTGFRLGHVI